MVLRLAWLFSLLIAAAPALSQATWRAALDSAIRYRQSGDFANAHATALRAARLGEPTAPADSVWLLAIDLARTLPDSVGVLTHLAAGSYFLEQQEPELARRYLAEGTDRADRHHLPRLRLTGRNGLAKLEALSGNYLRGWALTRQVLNDPDVASYPGERVTALLRMADFDVMFRRNDSARIRVEEALRVLKKRVPVGESALQPLALLQSARLAYLNNDLAASLRTIEEAYTLTGHRWPDDPMLIQIGYFYTQIVSDINDEKALEATRTARRVLNRQAHPTRHPYFLRLLNNEIGMLYALERWAEAGQLADSVLRQHPLDELDKLAGFPQFISTLSRVYVVTRREAELDQVARKARQLLPKSAEPSFLHTLLGRYHQHRREYTEAIGHIRQELRLDSLTQGVTVADHPTLKRLAVCQSLAGQRAEALATFGRVVKQFETNLGQLGYMTELERANFFLTINVPGLFWFLLQHPNPHPDELGLAYDFKLLGRGALLRIERAIHEQMHRRSDSTRVAALLHLRGQLTDRRLLPASREALQPAADSLERALSGDTPPPQATKPMHWTDVRARLKADEAAVELVAFTNFLPISHPKADTVRYAALLLRPEWPAPRVVLLPRLTNADSAVFAGYEASLYLKTPNGRAYDRLWRPIADALGPVRRVYLATDGVYGLVSLPTLFNDRTGRFLLDETDLVLLNSTQDLTTPARPTARNTAVLFGHPAFRTDADATSVTSPKTSPRRVRLRNGSDVPELPATAREVRTVAGLLRAHGHRVLTRTRLDAAEPAFHALQSPRLLHVATHGFSDLTTHPLVPQLLACSLALAGAADTARTARADGFLTGYEACLLNLHGTELVVLSACRTGAGDYLIGEGVYGLQRAFLSAGAGAVLTSLWDVDDADTQLLITEFYRGWLGGLSKSAALRQAQRRLRAIRPQPRVWGAFALLGR